MQKLAQYTAEMKSSLETSENVTTLSMPRILISIYAIILDIDLNTYHLGVSLFIFCNLAVNSNCITLVAVHEVIKGETVNSCSFIKNSW